MVWTRSIVGACTTIGHRIGLWVVWELAERPGGACAAICATVAVYRGALQTGHVMRSAHLTRRIAAFAGGLAVVGMGALTACNNSAQESPTTTTPMSTTTVSPTEKAVTPGGPNSFSPTVANPPGATCSSVVGNTCYR